MGERVFTTMDDVKGDVISTLIESGQRIEDYDIDAIAELTHRYGVKRDEAGNELLNTAGFRRLVSAEEFWHIVASRVYTPGQKLSARIDKIEDLCVREWAITARDMGLKIIFSPDYAQIVIHEPSCWEQLWIKGEHEIWSHEDGQWGEILPEAAIGVLGRMKRAMINAN